MVKLTRVTNTDTASSNSNKMPATVNENRYTQTEITIRKTRGHESAVCKQHHTNEVSPILTYREFLVTVHSTVCVHCTRKSIVQHALILHFRRMRGEERKCEQEQLSKSGREIERVGVRGRIENSWSHSATLNRENTNNYMLWNRCLIEFENDCVVCII